jgi:hypothetical protein
LSGQGQKFTVRGASLIDGDRDLGGLTAQWQHNFDAQNQLTAFAQVAFIRYPDQDVRDVNRYAGGVGWGHAFAQGASDAVVFVSAFGGTEDAIEDTFGEHFGRDFIGVRAGGQITVMPKLYANGSFTYQHSDYDEADPAFLVKRDDDYVDVGLGLRYQYDRNWSVRPEVRYTNNDSNIVITDYDRVAVMMTIRNDF